MEHFDITSILTERQVADLIKSALIPEWMNNVDVTPGVSAKSDMDGFVFGEEEDEEEAGSDASGGAGRATGGAGVRDRSKRVAPTAGDDDIDIDNI